MAISTLKPLAALQNRVIRITTFAPYGRVDLDPVYRDLKILGLPETHFLEKAKFMHKYHKGKLPTLFNDYFQTDKTVSHSYNLRRVHYSKPILSIYSERMIKYNGMDIWNTIPNDIQIIDSIKSFAYRLKKDILLV